MHSNNLRHIFSSLLKDAGLPEMRIHDLRHSATTILLEMGVPAHVVQEILGHSHVTITLTRFQVILTCADQEQDRIGAWQHKAGFNRPVLHRHRAI
jgi:integrase